MVDHLGGVQCKEKAGALVRLGQVVLCNGFRNPALVGKMAGTLDVISGGRFELGIGAGWKRDEWQAYGYGFPETGQRLGIPTPVNQCGFRILEEISTTPDLRHKFQNQPQRLIDAMASS
jgi:hypothetical protein